MDVHVLAPLDPDHEAAAGALARAAAEAAGLDPGIVPARHHVSLVVATTDGLVAAQDALRAVASEARPVLVRAHGYGVFCDRDPTGISLHVPLVRSPALDALHRAVLGAFGDRDVAVATWTDLDHWSPHVTLLDRGLDATRIGAAVARLAERHHPSWALRLDRLELAAARGTSGIEPVEFELR